MVSEMVQNSQSLYSFTFNALFIIHEYIYSHSITKFLFKKYIYSHLTTCFLFTKIFTHIYGCIYSHSAVYVCHIHNRNVGSTRCNIHSTFSAHPLCASLGPSSRSFLNAKWWRKKGLVGWKCYTGKIFSLQLSIS